jgi:chromate reductase, NAD(P)H dehydrogenase (quinone)
LMSINVATMPHPEAYIGGASALFDGAGTLIDAATKEFVTNFMVSFKAWVEQQRCRPA